MTLDLSKPDMGDVGWGADVNQNFADIESVVNALLPVGVVLPFAGASAPTGYLACDGSAVSRSTYADLFAVIGAGFGQGDGSTTFNLPDLRGRFLRGVDHGQGRDPDRASRTAMATGGNTGDNVGSVQSDASARPNSAFSTNTEAAHSHGSAGGHAHRTPLLGNSGSVAWGAAAGSVNGINGYAYANSTPCYTSTDGTHSHGTAGAHSHSVTGGGDNETRPTNAYVEFIIKC